MNEFTGWSIIGDGELASVLRRAAEYIPIATRVTVIVDTKQGPEGAFALGSAMLQSPSERVVPLESAFEAVEAVRASVAAGECGRVYGCFTSIRVRRGSSSSDVRDAALLPAIAMTLDTVPGPLARVWARQASLFAPDDAWFVTIRLRDETLLTIEVMASEPDAGAREILVELTSSERVLRAEPTRQAVVVEPLGQAAMSRPWWEDLGERYLRLVLQRAERPHDGAGTRLRTAWEAILTSASSGEPVEFT
ncbi:MAG TPA: hypothetical protein VMM78_15310 [Thermomicrobiales bacterium]|nr:hypothetical protein [Thermomicrobiales bacterium]